MLYLYGYTNTHSTRPRSHIPQVRIESADERLHVSALQLIQRLPRVMPDPPFALPLDQVVDSTIHLSMYGPARGRLSRVQRDVYAYNPVVSLGC